MPWEREEKERIKSKMDRESRRWGEGEYMCFACVWQGILTFAVMICYVKVSNLVTNFVNNHVS